MELFDFETVITSPQHAPEGKIRDCVKDAVKNVQNGQNAEMNDSHRQSPFSPSVCREHEQHENVRDDGNEGGDAARQEIVVFIRAA